MLIVLTELVRSVINTWLALHSKLSKIFFEIDYNKNEQIQALVPCSRTSKARWWQIQRRDIIVRFTTSVNSSAIFCGVVWNQQRFFFVAFCLLRIHIHGDLKSLNPTVRCLSITSDALCWNLPSQLTWRMPKIGRDFALRNIKRCWCLYNGHSNTQTDSSQITIQKLLNEYD